MQQLLGLSADDFMRVVVLPQGRFMRFLHLEGAERRDDDWELLILSL